MNKINPFWKGVLVTAIIIGLLYLAYYWGNMKLVEHDNKLLNNIAKSQTQTLNILTYNYQKNQTEITPAVDICNYLIKLQEQSGGKE